MTCSELDQLCFDINEMDNSDISEVRQIIQHREPGTEMCLCYKCLVIYLKTLKPSTLRALESLVTQVKHNNWVLEQVE